MKRLIYRKLVTTYFATTMISLLLAYLYINGDFSDPNLGNSVFGWTFFYMIYVGTIILLYGNLVSIGIEYFQRKWKAPHSWLYILLHGIFGLANGLLFQELMSAVVGMAAALLYAVIDRWLYKIKKKGIKLFIFIPIIVYALMWGCLQVLSPPTPPFTADDAVEYATSGKGTAIELFPEEIGKWSGEIDGYHVVRKTSVEKVEHQVYIVIFTEAWVKGEESGSRYISYEVERQSLTVSDRGGPTPPYYK